MRDRHLSNLATVSIGVALLVGPREPALAWPSTAVGALLAATGSVLVVLGVAALAVPDATVLGIPIQSEPKPRWLSLTVLALCGAGSVLFLLGV